MKEKKTEPFVCSLFDFPGFDSVRLPNLSVQFSYSQRLMIRQNASLTKKKQCHSPHIKEKGRGKKKKTGAELHCLETLDVSVVGSRGLNFTVSSQGPLKQKSEADGAPKALEWDWGPPDGFSAWRY